MTTLELDPVLNAYGPVAKTPLAERIAVLLIRFILSENLVAGEQLPSERELTRQLGVSHRVIREALGILVGQRMIVKEHGRGVFVTDFDRARAQAELILPTGHHPQETDLHKARCAIEIGMMPLVVQAAQAEDLAALQRLIDQMRGKVAAGASPIGEDLMFHQALLKATRNATLQDMSYLITESMQRAVYDSPGWLHRSMGEMAHVIPAHQAIVDAVRARDAMQATQAMLAHLTRSLASG